MAAEDLAKVKEFWTGGGDWGEKSKAALDETGFTGVVDLGGKIIGKGLETLITSSESAYKLAKRLEKEVKVELISGPEVKRIKRFGTEYTDCVFSTVDGLKPKTYTLPFSLLSPDSEHYEAKMIRDRMRKAAEAIKVTESTTDLSDKVGAYNKEIRTLAAIWLQKHMGISDGKKLGVEEAYIYNQLFQATTEIFYEIAREYFDPSNSEVIIPVFADERLRERWGEKKIKRMMELEGEYTKDLLKGFSEYEKGGKPKVKISNFGFWDGGRDATKGMQDRVRPKYVKDFEVDLGSSFLIPNNSPQLRRLRQNLGLSADGSTWERPDADARRKINEIVLAYLNVACKPVLGFDLPIDLGSVIGPDGTIDIKLEKFDARQLALIYSLVKLFLSRLDRSPGQPIYNSVVSATNAQITSYREHSSDSFRAEAAILDVEDPIAVMQKIHETYVKLRKASIPVDVDDKTKVITGTKPSVEEMFVKAYAKENRPEDRIKGIVNLNNDLSKVYLAIAEMKHHAYVEAHHAGVPYEVQNQNRRQANDAEKAYFRYLQNMLDAHSSILLPMLAKDEMVAKGEGRRLDSSFFQDIYVRWPSIATGIQEAGWFVATAPAPAGAYHETPREEIYRIARELSKHNPSKLFNMPSSGGGGFGGFGRSSSSESTAKVLHALPGFADVAKEAWGPINTLAQESIVEITDIKEAIKDIKKRVERGGRPVDRALIREAKDLLHDVREFRDHLVDQMRELGLVDLNSELVEAFYILAEGKAGSGGYRGAFGSSGEGLDLSKFEALYAGGMDPIMAELERLINSAEADWRRGGGPAAPGRPPAGPGGIPPAPVAPPPPGAAPVGAAAPPGAMPATPSPPPPTGGIPPALPAPEAGAGDEEEFEWEEEDDSDPWDTAFGRGSSGRLALEDIIDAEVDIDATRELIPLNTYEELNWTRIASIEGEDPIQLYKEMMVQLNVVLEDRPLVSQSVKELLPSIAELIGNPDAIDFIKNVFYWVNMTVHILPGQNYIYGSGLDVHSLGDNLENLENTLANMILLKHKQPVLVFRNIIRMMQKFGDTDNVASFCFESIEKVKSALESASITDEDRVRLIHQLEIIEIRTQTLMYTGL